MTIYGIYPYDKFGCDVSSAGDLNKDGIDDIIIGANQWDSSKGLVFVIYGSKTPSVVIDLAQGLKPEQGFFITGSTDSDYFGTSVSWAGDVNSDGIDDVIMSAPQSGSGLGTVYVVFGKEGLRNEINLTSGLSPSDGFMMSGAWEFNNFGYSVNGAGDVDGDGIADIIIGAHGGRGAVYIIYGKDMGNPFPSMIDVSPRLSASEGFMVTGVDLSSHFGYAVGNAGDFNGDGYDDVIVGAPAENSGRGAVYMILGGPRSQLSDVSLSSGINASRGIVIKGMIQADLFGYAVNGAGDINGDGIDDIIIGAPIVDDKAGTAFVLFGSRNFESEINFGNDLGTHEGFSIMGGSPGDLVGSSVSKAGDVNGDGMTDLIVGAAGVNSSSGAAYILFTKIVCPERCQTCEKTTTGKRCLSCEMGYGLYDSKCIVCPGSTTELINGVCVAKKSPLKTITGISKELFDSGSTTSRIFTMGRSLSVGLGLMAKIIQNVRYLNISYPQETLDAFESYGTDLFELPIPEIFYESPETKELPSQYSRYDISPTFMENYWQTIIMILISLACFFLIRLIQFLTRSQNKDGILQIALKNIGQTAVNFLVIQIYSNLDVIFYFLLDTSSTKLNSPSARGSLSLACFFLLLGLCFVFFHCWILSKYQQAKLKGTLQKFTTQYRFVGTLYEDFKDDNTVKQSFFGILILRCVFLVLVIMLLQPPWIQASLLMLTNLIFLGYFIYQRPFKNFVDEISQYFCELTIFTAYLGVLILSILDYQEDYTSRPRDGFGKCIVIAGIVLSLGGFLIQVAQILRALYGIYQFFRDSRIKKKRCRVSRLAASDLIHNKITNKNEASKKTLKEKSEIIENVQLEWSGISQKDPDCIEKSHYLMNNNLEISSVNTECALILKKKSLIQVHPLNNGSFIREEGTDKSLRNTQESQQNLDGEFEIAVQNEIQKKRKKFKRRVKLPDLSNSDER